MEFFRVKRDLPFMRYARLSFGVSLLLILLSLVSLATRGLNMGVDFTGGTVMEVSYPQPADLNAIRATLAQNGLGDASVQNFGSARDVLLRLPVRQGVTSAQLSERVREMLVAQSPDARVVRVDFVGPQVGGELFESGLLALLVVSLGITAYLAVRFEWKFSAGAIVASAHDVILILGLWSFFQWEFNLTILAAVLAILGYSVNDTVVVFDRVRENFRKMRKEAVPHIIDNALTATLSRTFMTAFTTLLMVFAMLFLGGEVLHYFALALTLGIVVGAYSSVLVASPIVMWLGLSREDLVKPVKKEAEDALP